MWKSRKVAARFKRNPTWSVEAFDTDTQDNIEQLYGIFLENGWSEATPRVSFTGRCVRETFNFQAMPGAARPTQVRLVSNETFSFFKDKIEVGRLVREFTDMSIRLKDQKRPRGWWKNPKKQKRKSIRNQSDDESVGILLDGTETTVMSVRLANPEDV